MCTCIPPSHGQGQDDPPPKFPATGRASDSDWLAGATSCPAFTKGTPFLADHWQSPDTPAPQVTCSPSERCRRYDTGPVYRDPKPEDDWTWVSKEHLEWYLRAKHAEHKGPTDPIERDWGASRYDGEFCEVCGYGGDQIELVACDGWVTKDDRWVMLSPPRVFSTLLFWVACKPSTGTRLRIGNKHTGVSSLVTHTSPVTHTFPVTHAARPDQGACHPRPLAATSFVDIHHGALTTR